MKHGLVVWPLYLKNYVPSIERYDSHVILTWRGVRHVTMLKSQSLQKQHDIPDPPPCQSSLQSPAGRGFNLLTSHKTGTPGISKLSIHSLILGCLIPGFQKLNLAFLIIRISKGFRLTSNYQKKKKAWKGYSLNGRSSSHRIRGRLRLSNSTHGPYSLYK